MLLTATAGSYKVGAVVNAVKAILANQRGTHKQKETFSAEAELVTTEVSDDEELVQVLAAELQGKPDYHEEELIEVYETYKQVRSKMNEVKKTRGFRSFGGRSPESASLEADGINLSTDRASKESFSMSQVWATGTLEARMQKGTDVINSKFIKCYWTCEGGAHRGTRGRLAGFFRS